MKQKTQSRQDTRNMRSSGSRMKLIVGEALQTYTALILFHYFSHRCSWLCFRQIWIPGEEAAWKTSQNPCYWWKFSHLTTFSCQNAAVGLWFARQCSFSLEGSSPSLYQCLSLGVGGDHTDKPWGRFDEDSWITCPFRLAGLLSQNSFVRHYTAAALGSVAFGFALFLGSNLNNGWDTKGEEKKGNTQWALYVSRMPNAGPGRKTAHGRDQCITQNWKLNTRERKAVALPLWCVFDHQKKSCCEGETRWFIFAPHVPVSASLCHQGTSFDRK